MIRFIKKSILPVIFMCVMLFSVACDKSDGNSDNKPKNAPPSYELTSAEAVTILDGLTGEIDSFILKMNEKGVLADGAIAPNMIPSVVAMLNDSYKTSTIAENFVDDDFKVNELYANKTLITDKFVSIKTENNEKLSLDLVSYTSVEIDGSNYEMFENYLYEIIVNEGDIKSLRVRNFLSNDKIPSLSNASNITMYEIFLDFENEVFDIFYAKPTKQYAWMLNDEYLDNFFDEERLVQVEWGFLYTINIDLNAQNMVVSEKYIDELTTTLKTEIVDFNYTAFDINLTALATAEEFVEIDDIFAEIGDISYVEYNDAENKFIVAG